VKLIPSCAGPLGNLQIKCVEANVSHWKTWFESHSQRHDSKEASTLVAPQYKRRTKTPCCQPAHQPCNISLSVLEFSSMSHWKPLSSLGGDPNPHHRLLHIPKWNLICTTIPCAIQGIPITKLHWKIPIHFCQTYSSLKTAHGIQ
jgi:hypothetical protein